MAAVLLSSNGVQKISNYDVHSNCMIDGWVWKARKSSSRYAMRFLICLDVRIILLLFLEDAMYDGYPSPSYLLVHGP